MNDNDDAWIPDGIFHDCIGNGTLLGVTKPVVDNVSSFNNSALLNCISNSPADKETVRTQLINNILSTPKPGSCNPCKIIGPNIDIEITDGNNTFAAGQEFFFRMHTIVHPNSTTNTVTNTIQVNN